MVKLSRQIGVNIGFSNHIFKNCAFQRVVCTDLSVETIIHKLTAHCISPLIKLRNGEIALSDDISPVYLIGKVRDATTNEVLVDAIIKARANNKVVSDNSDVYGTYALKLKRDTYKIQIQCVGYITQTVSLSIKRSIAYNIRLTPINNGGTSLKEVDILAAPAHTQSPFIKQSDGSHQMRVMNKQLVPAPGGQTDLVHSLAENAGVLTGVDGIGGLHVRGGNNDQNLMLLDDVPVYNPSHALGMFSIFNSDAIKSAQLWKGDFPSRYGGRAASVIDIRTKDGNSQKLSGGANINLIGISTFLEGPLPRQQNKGSFAISARHSLIQPWANRFNLDSNILHIAFNQLRYKFYDGNIKINQEIGKKNKFYGSFYVSNDRFSSPFSQNVALNELAFIQNQDTIASSWGNTISSLRWWHTWGEHLFANTTLSYSHFQYKSLLRHLSDKYDDSGRKTPISDYAQLYQSDIRDLAIRSDFSYILKEKLETSFGYSSIYHIFRPGTLSVNYLLPGQDSLVVDYLINTLSKNKDLEAVETELYGEATWLITPDWNCTAGVNASWFATDHTWYRAFSPRLKLLHGPAVESGWAQWIGYRQMVQYMHQIGSFNIGLPFELWVPSTQKVKPEIVRQISLGSKWSSKTWSATAELYYKKMSNTLVLLATDRNLSAGGAEDANGWDDRIARGQGSSKGVEFMFAKRQGATQGHIAYTLSQSQRQFDDLNLGRPFPFQFDRPHNIKMFLTQDITSWLNISAHWTYMSGNPITLALAKYTQNDKIIYYYSELNGFRLRPAHRLDVVANLSYIQKQTISHKIQIGVYNLYNRYNPFYLIVDSQSGQPNRAIEYTLLPFMPTLRYNLIF